MRILHLVQQPQHRGAEVFAYDLTAELLRMGHDVSTTYLYPATGTRGLPLHSTDSLIGANPRHFSERIPGINPGLVRKLARLVQAFEPEIVQANGARTLKYGSVLRRIGHRQPFGLVYRSIGDPGVWVTGRAKKNVYRRLIMPKVDGVAAVSANTLDGLTRLYNLDGKAVAQIPRGIDPRRLDQLQPRQEVRRTLRTGGEDPVALYIGSLTREKRPDRLARVFAMVAAEMPNATLWVLGEGSEAGALEGQISHAGLKDRVRFVGVTEDVGSYIGAADVLVLTSDTEGLPGVVLEAAALGVPAAATDVGGVKDAVVHQRTGLLAAPSDERSLADARALLLGNPSMRTELGQGAQRQFREKFDIAQVAGRYIDLYEQVVAKQTSLGRPPDHGRPQ